jgi:hypothetical protein
VRDIIVEASENSIWMDPQHTHLWVVRPEVQVVSSAAPVDLEWKNSDPATNPWGSEVECIFPQNRDLNPAAPNDRSPACTAVNQVDPAKVLADVEKIYNGSDPTDVQALQDEILVVVIGYYEVPSILNLPFWRVASGASGRIPIWSYSIIRQEVKADTVAQQSGGCSAYPLAFHTGLVSNRGNTLNPDETNPDLLPGEGDVFTASMSSTGYQLLMWRSGSSTKDSLVQPGNSTHPDWGYVNPSNPTDDDLHRTDPVLISNNAGPSVDAVISTNSTSHYRTGRALRVIVFRTTGPGVVNIAGFAIVRIKQPYSYPGSMAIEFIRWDTSCGRP